jgi:hypothetical protein
VLGIIKRGRLKQDNIWGSPALKLEMDGKTAEGGVVCDDANVVAVE